MISHHLISGRIVEIGDVSEIEACFSWLLKFPSETRCQAAGQEAWQTPISHWLVKRDTTHTQTLLCRDGDGAPQGIRHRWQKKGKEEALRPRTERESRIQEQ